MENSYSNCTTQNISRSFLLGFQGHIKRKVSIKQNTFHKIFYNIETKFKFKKKSSSKFKNEIWKNKFWNKIDCASCITCPSEILPKQIPQWTRRFFNCLSSFIGMISKCFYKKCKRVSIPMKLFLLVSEILLEASLTNVAACVWVYDDYDIFKI